ncbi:MAG: hypothetical protein Q7S52_04105 [bacterium]|nr:hypothetical protein [bacterium]
MFRKSFAVFVFLFALFVPITVYAGFTQNPSIAELSPRDRDCVEKMKRALDQHIGLYRGNPLSSVEVVAINDLLCVDPEWMMNVVVTIKDTHSDNPWYGILHIHFLPDGTFRSATSLNMEGRTWIEFRFPSEWQKEWCGFIETVYPDDFARQCKGF